MVTWSGDNPCSLIGTGLVREGDMTLKQRNSLLKQRGRNEQLDVWDHELAQAGEPMTRLREDYLAQLQGPLA